MTMAIERLVLILTLLVIGALGYAMPALTRPDLFFAVTIAPEFRRTDAARRIKRRYRTILVCATAAALALQLVPSLAFGGLLILPAGYLWAIVDAHRRARPHAVSPSSVREVDLAAPREGLPGGPVLALAPLASIGILAIWVAMHWDRLPSRLPLHWGFHGADRWVDTNFTNVAGLLALFAALSLLPVGVAWGIVEWSRRVSSSLEGRTGERWFRRRVAQLLVVIGVLVSLSAWFAFLQPAAIVMDIWAAVLAIVTVGFTLSLILAGQGGSRQATPDAVPAGDRTPDACWKWGLIYVNPADPLILVEKRFGVGYTLNFGNRWSWALLALVLAPLAIGALLLR
jgi:uncharacterized membrane protein